jgi:hypothetical protein
MNRLRACHQDLQLAIAKNLCWSFASRFVAWNNDQTFLLDQTFHKEYLTLLSEQHFSTLRGSKPLFLKQH